MRDCTKTGDSYRVDETYVRIKGRWYYLYRAVDKDGNTIDFLLSKHRDQLAAARFLKKALNEEHTVAPIVINTNENAAYGPAIESAKSVGVLGKEVEYRKVKYLNNNIESDHRRVKKLIKFGLWLKSFRTAYKTIRGYEAMHMIMKGQMKNAKTSLEQKREIEKLFGLAA
ncbi:MAG: IS6 family transposase [Oligoflexales bacterium]